MDLKIEITDAGTPFGTRILDAATGEDVTERLQAHRIALVAEARQAPRIEVGMLSSLTCSDGAPAAFFVGDPIDGRYKQVARIEFVDGSVAEFPPSDGAPTTQGYGRPGSPDTVHSGQSPMGAQ